MAKIVGVDLGTTNSVVAVVQDGEPVVIPTAEGSHLCPSVVAFTPKNEVLVGQIELAMLVDQSVDRRQCWRLVKARQIIIGIELGARRPNSRGEERLLLLDRRTSEQELGADRRCVRKPSDELLEQELGAAITR